MTPSYAKMIMLWVLGSLFILVGSATVSGLYLGSGTNTAGGITVGLLSLLFIMIGGLFWIGVSIAIRRVGDDS